MDILIIGNGFDLAHGLKTSYKHFLDFCKEQNNKRISMAVNYGTTFIDNIWVRHFLMREKQLGNTWIDLEQEIYKVIKNVSFSINHLSSKKPNFKYPVMFSIRKDVLEFDFNKIFDYMKPVNNMQTIGKKGYIEIETNDFSCLYYHIENSDGLIHLLYDQLREFTKVFEQYLINEVMAKLVSDDKYILTLPTSNTKLYVLSFNYTDTCFKLYDHSRNPYTEYSIETIFVHGKAQNSNDCELVLGTYSFNNHESKVASELFIPKAFNIFKKHYQRHKYGTIEPYQDLLKKLINQEQKIKPVFHIIGHSLDETDHKILRHILTANKNATIKIYYHSEDAQEKMMRNIDDIIGEEEVMTRVQLIDQHDEKRGLLRPVKKKVLISS